MRPYSKSAITFKEFEKKINEFHDFGNEWGLYIDIEKNYNDMKVSTRKSVRVNEYGYPEYVFQVEQIYQKKMAPTILPKIHEVNEEKDANPKNIKIDIDAINNNNDNHNHNTNAIISLCNLSLTKLFVITTSISIAVSSTFFMYCNFSDYFNHSN